MVFIDILRTKGCRRTFVQLGIVCLGLSLRAPTSTVSAQAGDVTGIVRDSLNNETLPNAAVLLLGERHRTLTDEFGNLELHPSTSQ